MVTDIVLSGLFGIVGTVVGYGVAGVLNIYREDKAQEAENKRLHAEVLAKQQGETLLDLSQSLEKSRNDYLTNLRGAAQNSISKEDYEENIANEFEDFRRVLEKSSLFLSEHGEALLRRYHDQLLSADEYIRWKAEQYEGSEFIEGDPKSIWRRSSQPPEINFDWDRFDRTYHKAKNAMKEEVDEILNPVR